ncbi:uncharacterized protein P884DRAFT_4060 [Thermothelomyces heterothallicus CBS 202.75]|uniref:uncharacterized protein n=1 Tax=Thermothelomyces heterothallicus CBS 202.75 TaxID=1149848 RepID=UPI0037445129
MVGEWGGGVGHLILGVWQGEWAVLILLPVNCCAWAKPGIPLLVLACCRQEGFWAWVTQFRRARSDSKTWCALSSPPLSPKTRSRSWRRVWLSAVTLKIFQQTMPGSMIAQSSGSEQRHRDRRAGRGCKVAQPSKTLSLSLSVFPSIL